MILLVFKDKKFTLLQKLTDENRKIVLRRLYFHFEPLVVNFRVHNGRIQNLTNQDNFQKCRHELSTLARKI